MGIVIRETSTRPDTLEIASIVERVDDGRDVRGFVLGHEFEAVVFAVHAGSAECELGWSRITDLVVRPSGGAEVCFRWRCGPDVKPCGPAVEAVVEVIAAYLADRVFPDPFGTAVGNPS
jgi:hypothetical protein